MKIIVQFKTRKGMTRRWRWATPASVTQTELYVQLTRKRHIGNLSVLSCLFLSISLLKTDSDVGYLRLCLCFVKSLFSFVWPYWLKNGNVIANRIKAPFGKGSCPWTGTEGLYRLTERQRDTFSDNIFQFSIDKGQCLILWKYAVSGQTQKKTVFTEICHHLVTISTYSLKGGILSWKQSDGQSVFCLQCWWS